MTDRTNVVHADNVERADHADHVDNLGPIVVTPAPRSKLASALEVGKFVTMLLMASTAFLLTVYLVPANRTLTDDIVEARAVRQQLQEDLRAERAEDDIELRQSSCEDAHSRRITRATDGVNTTEAAVFLALLTDGDNDLGPATAAYQAATERFSLMVASRDAYIANGSPLPCPLVD